jgi:cell division protease FtsH
MRLPENDRISMSREKLEADLIVAMGGRVAEELTFGHAGVTTGASQDFRMATEVARRMVTEWGMSDTLGPLTYGDSEQEVFLGHSVTQRKSVSDATAKIIDQEIRIIIDTAYQKAQAILTEHHDQLETLAQGLLEYETLSGDEIQALLRGETIVRRQPDDKSAQEDAPRSSVPTSGTSKGRPKGGLEPESQPGA